MIENFIAPRGRPFCDLIINRFNDLIDSVLIEIWNKFAIGVISKIFESDLVAIFVDIVKARRDNG